LWPGTGIPSLAKFRLRGLQRMPVHPVEKHRPRSRATGTIRSSKFSGIKASKTSKFGPRTLGRLARFTCPPVSHGYFTSPLFRWVFSP
jgi:hypothetical protein